MTLLEQIIAKKHEAKKLQEEINSMLDRWCVEACPYKVGEKIVCRGYSYQGKWCVVDKVGWCNGWDHKPQWRVVVTVCKKDGSPGLISTDWIERQEK